MNSNKPLNDILTYDVLKELREEKFTLSEIAKKLSCSEVCVSKYLKRYNLVKKHKKYLTHEQLDKVLTFEYLQTVHLIKTIQQIGDEVGCDKRSVEYRLKKLNLSIKDSRKNIATGSKNGFWRGGRHLCEGEWQIWVGKNTYRAEHTVIIETIIKRKLFRDELVHHLNGNHMDNSEDNLCVLKVGEHSHYHNVMRRDNVDISKHKLSDVLDFLYPGISKEFKMYAELTRIGIVRSEG